MTLFDWLLGIAVVLLFIQLHAIASRLDEVASWVHELRYPPQFSPPDDSNE